MGVAWLGDWDGRPYAAMGLEKGPTLKVIIVSYRAQFDFVALHT